MSYHASYMWEFGNPTVSVFAPLGEERSRTEGRLQAKRKEPIRGQTGLWQEQVLMQEI